MSLAQNASKNIADRLTWHTANRDQAGIAKDLAEGKDIVFGFKIWVVWDPNSRLPLAMRFATIEVHDINFAQEVVQKAIDNLGEHAKITSLAIDRGFTDGIFFWWINCKNITFFIPAKFNLDVYGDALSLIGTGHCRCR